MLSLVQPTTWRVRVLPRFEFSRQRLAPAGSPQAAALSETLTSLLTGPAADDLPYMLPPCAWASARRVIGTDLAVVFQQGNHQTICVLAVAAVGAR